jgi:type II secretory pathway component GspD/PulD (secretin)
LPEDFRRIPLEHARSRVLASVPGTDQAAEAVLIASIPQTARVSKKDVKAPDVSFNGDPQFEAIQTTTVERAVNTDKDVFKVDGKYYVCFNGVWFVGPAATGPWEVASTIPQEIYKIPVSSPASHVTYVTVEDNDDEWVTLLIKGKNACVAHLVPVLRPLMPQAAHLAANPVSNQVVISDRAVNARRIAQLVYKIDEATPPGRRCADPEDYMKLERAKEPPPKK